MTKEKGKIPEPEIKIRGFTRRIEDVSAEASLYHLIDDGIDRRRMESIDSAQNNAQDRTNQVQVVPGGQNTSIWPLESALGFDNTHFDSTNNIFKVRINNTSNEEIKIISYGINYEIYGDIDFLPRDLSIAAGSSQDVVISCIGNPTKFVARTSKTTASGSVRPPEGWGPG